MHIPHMLSGGFRGLRTCGDLVARMQMRKMRLKDSKAYVAKRLGVDVMELPDEFAMRRLREKLDIGVITGVPGAAIGLEAKSRIAQVLGININCVDRLNRLSKM